MKKWIINKRENIFDGRLFIVQNLHCHHPEKSVDHGFFIMNTPDWINIVALTEDGRFIMVKQHRLGTDEFTLETPAGLMERDEVPENAALRELEEETGYVPEKIVLLKRLSANPAIMNNYIHFFFASGCRKTKNQKLDLAEDIEVHLFSPDEVLGLVRRGEINHSIIITALSLYFMSPYNANPDRAFYFDHAETVTDHF